MNNTEKCKVPLQSLPTVACPEIPRPNEGPPTLILRGEGGDRGR